MWIVAIAWLYVALMMSMAEATSAQGTVLGAIITFLFYGLGPVALVMYVLSTPARRRALREKEAQDEARRQAEQAGATGAPGSTSPADMPPVMSSATSPVTPPLTDADGRSLPAGDPVPPVRKEP